MSAPGMLVGVALAVSVHAGNDAKVGTTANTRTQ